MGAAITEAPVQIAPVPAQTASTDGSFARLLRFAVANVRRRPERFILSTLGIALAVMAVVLVRTIAAGYASSGSASLDDVLHGDPLWVVGANGFHYDPGLHALVPDGPAPELELPDGWTATATIGGVASLAGHRVALYGRDDVPAGHVLVGGDAAEQLDLITGDRLSIAGASFLVTVEGAAVTVTVPTEVAEPIVGPAGWWTVAPPAEQANQRNLGEQFAAATGLPTTTDPARTATDGERGLVYDTVGGSSLTTFAQKFTALFTGKVTSSALGIVSTVGLVLGFVIAVSSFLAAVQERRREFGIMSSIGLADEVLYFFLVESALVFCVAYLLGALAAGVAVALVVPGITTLGGWATSAGIVAAYLPAMAIVGALIPVHRLVQQRPVDLLRDA